MRFNRQATRRYYGWYIAVTLAVTETISYGVLYYAFSVFLTPMQTDLQWSRSELTAGFSLSLLTMGVLAFPIGAWIDRHSPRLLMTVGSITATLLVIAWSQVTNLTAFYVIWVGIGACAAWVLYEPAFMVIAQWFSQRRGMALATVTFAAGLASTIFLPLSDALLHTFGWRTAVLILGLFFGLMTVPLHALVLRSRPETLGLYPDGIASLLTTPTVSRPTANLNAALHSRIFWLLTLSFCLASLASAAIWVHLIPFLIEYGINPSTAAFATGSIGIMQVVGRLIFVPLERRWSGRVILIGVFLLQSAAILIILVGQAPVLIGLFVISFGLAQGSITLLRPSILTELYGSSHYGRISSIMAIFITIMETSAPLGASLIFDRFGSYRPMLWIVTGLAFSSATVAYLARPRMQHPSTRVSQSDLTEMVVEIVTVD